MSERDDYRPLDPKSKPPLPLQVPPQTPLHPSTPPQKGKKNDRLMTVPQVAARLQVTMKWVYVNQAAIPGRLKLSYKTLRWDREVLEAWISQETGRST